MKAAKLLFYLLSFLFIYQLNHAQTNFLKYSNPVLTPGEEGAWDARYITVQE